MTDEHEPAEPGETGQFDTPTEHVPVAESTDGSEGAAAETTAKKLPNRLVITLGIVGGVLLLGIASTVVWALASSADDDMPVPTPSASTPSTTPTPEPVHVPAPESRLALTCEQLAPGGLLRSVSPEAEKLVATDPAESWELRLAQAGGMTCEWTRSGRGGSYAPGDGLRFDVLPDAEADYLASFPNQVDTQYIAWDTAGDHSQLRCGVYGDYYGFCNAELVVRGYWFQLYASTSTDAGSEEELTEQAQALLEAISGAVRAAPADRPTPAAFPGAYSGDRLCSDLPRLVQAAWGWNVGLGDREGGYPNVGYLAELRVAVRACPSEYGESVPYVSVTVHPSSAWSIDRLVADLPSDGRRGSWTTVEVAGADAGLVACDQSGCDALISYRFSRVDVSIDGIGREEFVAGLPAFVAALS